MKNITPDYLRLRLRYEPATGKLFWLPAGREHFKLHRTFLAWNTRFAGEEAGSVLPNGYLYINIKKRVMLVHRVIWAMLYDYWPMNVDHIDHVRINNKLDNLREVSTMVNGQNITIPSDNTSGRIGVYWNRQRNTWVAKIKAGGKKMHLGSFKNKDAAIASRAAAEIRFGFHPNHGAPANQNLLREAA